MKKQILFIKGGSSRENYQTQMECIKDWEYDPYKMKKRWNMDLGEKLGEDYEILFPISGLNKMWSDYEEWKILFEKSFPYLQDNFIIIAHSLGGTFISKYLNENTIPVKIGKILLVSPAYRDDKNEVLGNFNFDKALLKFREYSHKIILYYSLDDTIVNRQNFLDFKSVLGKITLREFMDRGHFLGEEFPEIIEDVKYEKAHK